MDRNPLVDGRRCTARTSLSARRAWIEILVHVVDHVAACVALRKESVDRNAMASHWSPWRVVALRKESVDRNMIPASKSSSPGSVALRKESVDRNAMPVAATSSPTPSLSARRAWIEMRERQGALCGAFNRRSPQGERG